MPRAATRPFEVDVEQPALGLVVGGLECVLAKSGQRQSLLASRCQVQSGPAQAGADASQREVEGERR